MRMTPKGWAVLVALLASSAVLYRDAGQIGALAFVDRKVHEPPIPNPNPSPGPAPSAAPLVRAPPDRDETAEAFIARAYVEIHARVRSGEAAMEIVANTSGMFDAEEATRATFGEDWGALSEAEQREATTLLGSLFALHALRQVRETDGVPWTIVGSRVVRGETHVQANVRSAQGPLDVAYVLRRTAGSWQIVDIQTEGSSMQRGFGVQIHRLMKDDGRAAAKSGTNGGQVGGAGQAGQGELVLTKLRKKAAAEAAKAS